MVRIETAPARLPSGMPDEPLTPEVTTLPVLAVVRDLMFSSRIQQAGRHAGSEVKIVRDPATPSPSATGGSSSST